MKSIKIIVALLFAIGSFTFVSAQSGAATGKRMHLPVTTAFTFEASIPTTDGTHLIRNIVDDAGMAYGIVKVEIKDQIIYSVTLTTPEGRVQQFDKRHKDWIDILSMSTAVFTPETDAKARKYWRARFKFRVAVAK